jgi:penicillin-binding protein 2
MSDSTLRDSRREGELVQSRLLQGGAIVLCLLLMLLARLYVLQVQDHDHFATLSRENRIKLTPVPPTRGLIYDRNGVLLAGNQPAYALEITPERVKQLNQVLADLNALIPIPEPDIARFHKLRKRRPSFEGIPLRLNLSDEEVATVAVNHHRLPGVDIVATLGRYYPQGEHAVHAVGYVGRINEDELQHLDPVNYRGTNHVGKSGIERSYEELLHGEVGAQQVEINARGRALRKLDSQPAKPGKNLYLSLDSRLQATAEKALGAYKGAVVAIDPRNGEVLVFASNPGFDPNPFVNGIEPARYAALRDDPARPLYNRALLGRYPPGSTIKPFHALAGLEYGVRDLHDHTACPGYYRLPGDEHRYRDWKKEGHGSVDVRRAITESCDVYFYELGRALGIDRLHEFMSAFGFGKPTGIDIPDEPSGLYPSREWKRRVRQQPWYPGENLITGIGQGYMLATPLQLAQGTAMLAMRGQHIQPHLLLHSEDILTEEEDPFEPERGGGFVIKNPAHYQAMLEGMVAVVHSPGGTARRIAPGLPFQIAGKTGTAQVFGLKQDEKYNVKQTPEHLRDHALFVAFAPADAPRIAVAVVVENAPGGGGAYAAPVASAVIREHLGAPPLVLPSNLPAH